jgi:hypothetical protein
VITHRRDERSYRAGIAIIVNPRVIRQNAQAAIFSATLKSEMLMVPTRRNFLGLINLTGIALPTEAWPIAAAEPLPLDSKTEGGRPSPSIHILDVIPRHRWGDVLEGRQGFDVAPYVEAAIDTAISNRISWVEFGGTNFRMDRGVEVPIDLVSLRGSGCRISAVNLKSGSLFSISGKTKDLNVRAGRNAVGGIVGFEFMGPGVNTDVSAITFRDSAPTLASLANCSVEHCFFYNFSTDIRLSSGTFGLTVYKCAFTATGMSVEPIGYSIEIENSANVGERNEFISCQWFNRKMMIRQYCANASTMLTNCSLDYADGHYAQVNGGAMSLVQCHIEGQDDRENWIEVFGSDSVLRLAQCVLNVTGERHASSPFYADRSVTNGGILIRDLDLLAPHPWTAPLIAGSGRAQVTGLSHYRNGARPVISAFANLLAHGRFDNPRWEAEWTLTSSDHIGRSAVTERSMPEAVQIDGVVAATQQMTTRRDAKPGDYLSGKLSYRTVGLSGSGGRFYVRVAFLDSAGSPITGNAVCTITADQNSWERLSLHIVDPAPPGTVQFELLISIFNVEKGMPKAFVGDVNLNLA